MNCAGCPHGRRVSRRTVLKSLVGAAGVSLSLADRAVGAAKKKDDPRKLRPQTGMSWSIRSGKMTAASSPAMIFHSGVPRSWPIPETPQPGSPAIGRA